MAQLELVANRVVQLLSERNRNMKKRFKRFLFEEVASRPFVFAGVLLLQQEFEAWVAKWGGFAVRIALALLFFIGIVILARIGISILGSMYEMRKQGNLTMEQVTERFKPDAVLLLLAAVIITIPAALFLNFDTIQGLINRALGVGLEV